ncbi:hypothetical protein ACFLU6_13265 [Acidobacteriota bacterium]
MATSIPGVEQDLLVSADPLVLYRVLLSPGDTPAGNILRVTRQAGSVILTF